MINYHPTNEVLKRFAAGELPASVSVIVASHVEKCSQCREYIDAVTNEMAKALFVEDSKFVEDSTLVEENKLVDGRNSVEEKEFEQMSFASFSDESLFDSDALAMINSITSEQDNHATTVLAESTEQLENSEIDIAGKRLVLPRAMRSIALKEWQTLGKLSRSRLALDDDNLRMSLLSIESGGGIPSHSHNGFEITLLLQGSFDDELGHYAAGDFIWLDGNHNHTPVTQEGCVCLTVSSDSLHFTKGLSQLINPMGKFIY